jgi:preprotein translocase subunit SecF
MKLKKKEKIATIIIIILIIAIVILSYLKLNNMINAKNKIQYNTNKEFLQEKNIEGIQFSNFECYYDGEKSTISYDVTNTNANELNLEEYKLLIKDQNNEILFIGDTGAEETISPNIVQKIEFSVDIDLSNASKIEIKPNDDDEIKKYISQAEISNQET